MLYLKEFRISETRELQNPGLCGRPSLLIGVTIRTLESGQRRQQEHIIAVVGFQICHEDNS